MLENCKKGYVKAIYIKIKIKLPIGKDEGRIMPIESRKDKRSFNQGKTQQMSKVDTIIIIIIKTKLQT